jgi:hypothetical protein
MRHTYIPFRHLFCSSVSTPVHKNKKGKVLPGKKKAAGQIAGQLF